MLTCIRLFVTPWTVARQAPWLWNSPGKITGVSCYVLLQEILPTQGSNPRLLHLLHWQGGSLAPSGKPKSQASLSVGFSRQEYWSGLPFPPPGDLANPGIKPKSLRSPALADGLFTTSAIWEAPNLDSSSSLSQNEEGPPQVLSSMHLLC